MKKRWVASVLAATMAAAVIGGCGSGNAAMGTEGSAEETGVSSDQNETGETVQDETSDETQTDGERETLVVGIQTNTYITDYDNNYMTNVIEEELNVELEFYQLPSNAADLQTKLSLMATSGDDNMPDVFMLNAGTLTQEQILDYGTRGFFIPLNSYMEDSDSNYAQLPEEDRQRMDTAMTCADGNRYGLPNYGLSPWDDSPNRMFINGAWLDKLGLEVPETTDELYEVLKAFKENDPNGNGLQDELGVYGFTGGGYGQDIIDSLMNAFVFYNGGVQNNGLALDETGETVIAPFTTEEWREGLRYMNKLYTEGLLASSTFTDNDTAFKATLNSETNVVGLTSAGSTSNWTDADNNANFLEMDLIAPLTGPEGVCYTPYRNYAPGASFFITSTCENPELAFRLGDWFMDADNFRIARWGEEGVDWTTDPEVCAENTNGYVEAGMVDGVTLVYLTNIWSEPSNKYWHNANPGYTPWEDSLGLASGLAPYDATSKNMMLNAKHIDWYLDKHPEYVLPQLQYTSEEASQCTETMMSVADLVEQAKAEFITGTRDLDSGWDAYLEELESVGLSSWLEIAQTAYERSQAN
ncbi:MAG TPA: extracellular solute-binding protein [Candidatus Fimimorpha excrementavium]|nr:extracellular solute-binding protein [Candidatus Fimimorpha excrementavium]